MLNEKGFNAALKAISTMGDKLADTIHDAGLFALSQANEHGNIGFGTRLMEAMGKKHDAKRVEKWLCHFGKFGMKGKELVYKARKDINAATLDAFLTNANNMPYWELTEQEHHAFKVDYLVILKQAIKKHEKAQELEGEGKETEEKNLHLLDKIRDLIAIHEMTPAVAPVAAGDHMAV